MNDKQLLDLMTIEFSGTYRTCHPDIHIILDGKKLEALFLQLNNDDLNKLGKFPKYDNNPLSIQNYEISILNYLIKVLEVSRHARFRKAEDLLYNKIRNLIYDKDDISDEDVQTIINDMKILKIASQ